MNAQAATLLTVDQLKLQYGPADYCLEVASLEVTAGQLVVVWGRTGGGKTHLLESLTGLKPLEQDSVRVLGQSLQQMSLEQASRFRLAKVGLLFRKNNLVESLNVAENVALPAELNGVSHGKAQLTAGALLQSVGCSKLSEVFPFQIAPLDQLKIALARAINSEGKLIVADEPTGDLNSSDAEQFMQLLMDTLEKGYGCLLATNDYQVVKYADHLYRIVGQKLVYSPRLLSQVKAGKLGLDLESWNEDE